MNLSSLFHILIGFGALQALFLAIILGVRKRDLPSGLFAAFLFIEGFTLVERLLAETNLMVDFPHILGISYPLNFIKSPILFLLALSIIQPEFKLKGKHVLHAIPFGLMLLMNVPFYQLSGAEKVAQVSTFIHYVPEYSSFNFWFFSSFFLYIGIYLFLSIRVLSYYSVHIKTNPLANGYLRVMYLYSGLLIFQFLHFLLRPLGWVEFGFVNEASMLLMTFLIQSIAYTFLTQSKFLENQNGRFNHNLSQLSEDGDRIKKQLENEKVYLEDDLSLEGFASSLGWSKKRVSEVINQNFGTNFKGLVNQYRVEEAKSLMRQEKDQEIQLIQLGLRSGFNNKVSFYRTFKKATGKSPTEYFQHISKKS